MPVALLRQIGVYSMAKDYDFSKLNDVQEYCIDRLEEIRAINEISQTPSGFVCIAAFIGFLSNLASGKAEIGSDKANYVNFAMKYMSGLCPDQAKAEELYEVLRCGLLHAMSFCLPFCSGKMPLTFSQPPNRSKMSITHDVMPTGSDPNVISFDTLYQAVGLAIQKLFADSSAASKILTVVYWQPPIKAVSPSSTSTSDSDGTTEPNSDEHDETELMTTTHLSA